MSRGITLPVRAILPPRDTLPATQRDIQPDCSWHEVEHTQQRLQHAESPAGSPSSGPPVAEIWGVQIPSYWQSIAYAVRIQPKGNQRTGAFH
jgi:hypothetical protein